MLVGGAATFKDAIVHLERCENEVVKFYGSVSSHIFGVVSALESPTGVDSMLSCLNNFGSVLSLLEFTIDSEYEIATSPDLLEYPYVTVTELSQVNGTSTHVFYLGSYRRE